MINDLPTIFEIVTGSAKKQAKEKSSVSNHSSNKSKSSSKPVRGALMLKIFLVAGVKYGYWLIIMSKSRSDVGML